MGTKQNERSEYFEKENKGVIKKAICPGCNKHFTHRNKQRCPNCGIFLAWPGERFALWDKGFVWLEGDKWEKIEHLKEWLLDRILKDDLDHSGMIEYNGKTYFWRDTL